VGNVIILGAGLAGLSAAYHLERQGFSEYEVCEREPMVEDCLAHWSLKASRLMLFTFSTQETDMLRSLLRVDY
jgi:cation diffusion facilitator CzcD-associated flavoprotein CzcO